MTFSDNDFKAAITEYAARSGYKITKLALDRMDGVTMQIRIMTEPSKCQQHFYIPGEECDEIQIYPKIP